MHSLADTEVLSFRHLLTGAIERFLAEHRFDAPGMHDEVAEGMIALAHYREEGAPLFPAMFFCRDRSELLSYLGGTDPIEIGAGPLNSATVRRALKQCATLCNGSWAIYLVRGKSRYEYGVFRADDFVLNSTFMVRLREIRSACPAILGVVQLADNVIELRCSGGAGQLVHLSGARVDGTPVMSVYKAFAHALTADVPADGRGAVGTFFKRVLIDAMRGSHGCLVAVLPSDAPDLRQFQDGILLAEPLDVPGRIRRHLADPTVGSRGEVQALVPLVTGMLGADGITLLGSNGTILGYNVFLHMPPAEEIASYATGGARQRAYRALATQVGHGLRAAFIRSQDGFADCVVAP